MHITVNDPDNQLGMPAYDGEHDQAHHALRGGVYVAHDENGGAWTLTVDADSSEVTLDLTGHDFPIAPDFEPLRRVLPASGLSFSFMGTTMATGPDGEPLPIQRYKHKGTEKYLSLTADLQAFEVRFYPTETGDGVAVLLDLKVAKRNVFEPAS